MDRISFLCLAFCLLSPFSLSAQYQVNGNATANGGDCFTLTQNQPTQSGSVWTVNTIDLNQSFDLEAQVFLGCANGGADGMVFAFQSVSSNVGSGGGGMGYQGIQPSFAIEFDTYQNGGFGDPTWDHLAIVTQGSVIHSGPTSVVPPVPMLTTFGNTEDCQWHDVRISWNPNTDSLFVYFDCVLRIAYGGDIVNTYFAGDPNVFWGFTGGTGALSNLQQICYSSVTLGLDTIICQGADLPLTAGAGVTYSWSPSAGLSDSTIQNPMASPDSSTTYTCTITDACGISFEQVFTLQVVDTVAAFDLGVDTFLCPGQSLSLSVFQSGATYLWQDTETDTFQVVSNTGLYWAQVETGCDTLRDSINVVLLSPPVVDLGPDLTPCPEDTLFLDATHPLAQSYLWQDGSTDSIFQVVGSGTYAVALGYACGTVNDTIEVTYQPVLEQPSLGDDSVFCGPVDLMLGPGMSAPNYLWSTGASDSAISVTSAGLYWVQVSDACVSYRDTIVIATQQAPQVDLGNDTTLCVGQSQTWDVSWTPGTSYLWQNGSNNPVLQTISPGVFSVTLTNVCGTATDSAEVSVLAPPPNFDLGPDSTLCDGDQFRLDPGLTGYDFLWQDSSSLPTFTATTAGTFFVTVSNVCGSRRDTISMDLIAIPEVDLGPDRQPCPGEVITLDVSWPEATYAWSDGLQVPFREISQSANLSVFVTNQCGTTSDGINVAYQPQPGPVNLGPDREFCVGDTLFWNVDQGEAFDYLWSDGSTAPTKVIRRGGTFSVQVSSVCGTERDEATVSYLAPPEVDLGSDTVICTDQPRDIWLDASSLGGRASYLWQDGSTEPTFLAQEPGSYNVLLTNACGLAEDTVDIQPSQCKCNIYAPTAFSPNGDGYNELFQLFYECDIDQGRLMVFSRWGDKLFETDNPADTWDGTYRGTPMPQGVYVWVYEFTYQSGSLNRFWQDQGTVTLIR
ncbi:MAG: hypothetical protein D6722_18045 [Bacteroidetes bacterium]|nr:MAG: hypothetical protein D6722_18045 [Bacteroidota bacterium]